MPSPLLVGFVVVVIVLVVEVFVVVGIDVPALAPAFAVVVLVLVVVVDRWNRTRRVQQPRRRRPVERSARSKRQSVRKFGCGRWRTHSGPPVIGRQRVL